VARVSNGSIEHLRLAAGSVGPIPIRLAKTELALAGQPINKSLFASACKVITEEIQPIDDIRSTAEYRSVVLRNLLGEFLQGLPGAKVVS
jgi:xanthine dehydrogenase small subunit